MTQDERWKFSPFFDQEEPQKPVTRLIARFDRSQPYELDEAGVFACEPDGYLVVVCSGCSCWPDRGHTEQHVCPTKADVDRAITGEWRPLLQACQDAGW